MGSVKGKWTEKVKCGSPVEAQVEQDRFRRKGMIARINRRPSRRVDGKPSGPLARQSTNAKERAKRTAYEHYGITFGYG